MDGEDAVDPEKEHLVPSGASTDGSDALSACRDAQLPSLVQLEVFEREFYIASKDKDSTGRVRNYYESQCDNVRTLIAAETPRSSTDVQQEPVHAKHLALVSFIMNLLLLIGKSVAASISGSLAVLSSVIDSAVDLVSGIVIWYTSRKMAKIDPYHYPIGRSRLEPISVMLLSCIMATSSIMMIREAIEKIISRNMSYDFSALPLSIIGATIIIKLALFLYCRRSSSSSAAVLSQDHRNDCISNAFALVAGAMGAYVWPYLDPIGAILISMYIFASWWRTGAEQIRGLSGHVAPPDLLRRVTWLCVTHHKAIANVDTANAFHVGNNFLVEVHVVLHEAMSLKEAHDIGESLQHRIEALPLVERAFVHLDYEYLHHPSTEHKIL